jgi:Na+-driven multidrug efflux pump
VAGQNFGAKQAQRVKDTFKAAAMMAAAAMVVFTIICITASEPIFALFTKDPDAIAIGVEYLGLVSWTFAGSGVIFVASSMFQAMGNTVPSLAGSSARLLTFALPALILSRMPSFQLRWLWYLSVLSVIVHFILSLLLLRREYDVRLQFSIARPVEAEIPAESNA